MGYIEAYIHKYTYINTHNSTYIHTSIHTYIHTHIHTYRHEQKVAIQMLEIKGAYRQNDPHLNALLLQQDKDNKRAQKRQREEMVQEIKEMSVEEVPALCVCVYIYIVHVC